MTPPYNEMRQTYKEQFSLSNVDGDINVKFGLISMICFVTQKVQSKVPDATHYSVIKKIAENCVPDDFIKGLAIMCEDFSVNTKEFPTFGMDPKQIPNKIREIILSWLPF